MVSELRPRLKEENPIIKFDNVATPILRLTTVVEEMKLAVASLLLAAVLLKAASIAFCSDESPSENTSALVPDELLPLYTYYSTMINFRPCEHGCRCTDLVLSNDTECTEMMLSSEAVILRNAAGLDPTYDCNKPRFKVECAVSLSLILKQPYSSWDLECLDDLLLSVPFNTTDIVVSNFKPVRMSCGRKRDSAQFKWPWSDSHNPKELLTLTVNSSEIRDFSSNAFSLNLFASLVSIHIKNNDFVTFDEPQLHKKIFSGLPSVEIIAVVNNTNLRVIQTSTFSYLPQLKVINLTENSIKAIEQRAFGTRIRTVIANPKNISSISVTELGAASSLPQLTVLDLSHNSLQSLPRQDILELSNASLRYLYLDGNPWNCSCEMAWIVELNTSILAGPPGVCHHPSLLRGTALQQLNPKHFEHCFPGNSFNFNTIVVVLVTFAVICITALLFNRIYYLHTSKISIGQIEFDTKDSLGPNTFRGNMKDGRSIVVKRRSLLETKHSSELQIFFSLPYHSNVIQYLLREETNKVLYIALELCSGNLQDLLIDAIKENNNEVLQQLASREYLCQIAKGLCHLHSNGIEHRDLRPINILCGVNTAGNLKLIISNFYMACFTGRPSSLLHLPQYRCRTRGWCAPELWDGDTELITTAVDIFSITTAVDVFSMGCVFFYMLTRGAHPFGHLGDSDLLQKNIMRDQFSLNRLVDHQRSLRELASEKLGKDLIKSMIQHKAIERPNIYDVLKHQLLWDSKQQSQFQCKVVVGQIEYDSRESLSVNVYRGKLTLRNNNQRLVAVKKVPFFQQSKELDTLLSMKSHANVIQYLGKEVDGEMLFLALELCEGNLRDLIQAESMPNLLDIKDCLHQITEGVRHLHECDTPVQHQDIKPTNILWTNDTSGQFASGKRFVVSDFDMSRFSGDPSSNKSHYGTEGWSAPEMWDAERGSRTIAADIFSLGCVYFYVVTGGRHPFGMLDSRRELQDSIMRNQVSLGGVLTEKFGCYEGELSKELIVPMIQSDVSERPTARETLTNIFFWTQKKIAIFYDQVGNFLDKALKTETSAFFVEKLEHNSDEVIQGDWRARLDKVVRTDVKDYDKSKVYALLRVVRNKFVHYKDFGPQLKAAYDRRGGVVAYYHYHFPKLLLHTYLAAMQVKDQLPSQLRNSMT